MTLPPLSETTLDVGRRAAGGLLGVDALYRAESGDGDGLVVLNMDLEGSLEPEPFRSYHEARTWWRELDLESLHLPEMDRRLYYGQLCRSTLAFMEWRTQGMSFTDQLSRFLHVPAEPVSEVELDGLKKEMRALLTSMGYSGDLRAQCAAWEDRVRVPPDEVPGVIDALMKEAWARTEERLLEIPAPPTDGMRVSPVSGVAFNARCDYLQRTIDLNVDPVLTRPGLKHLAVHEGYPGHYVQFKLRETMAREGTAAADVLLSVVNTAGSSVFEGIADAGMAMIGWMDSDDDRLQGLMNRYRAAIGTVAAWKLHALEESESDVTDWLRSASLVGGEGWVLNRVGFIAAPARAVLIWSYWWGERSVLPVWERVAEEARAAGVAGRGNGSIGNRRPGLAADPEAFLRFLYGRMHSVQSVAIFGT